MGKGKEKGREQRKKKPCLFWCTLLEHTDHIVTRLPFLSQMIRLDVKAEAQQRILRELRVLFDCNSPYIIDFYGSFLSDGEINILLEYMVSIRLCCPSNLPDYSFLLWP